MRRAPLIGLLALAALTGWVCVSLLAPYRGFSAQGVYVDIPHGASQRTIAGLLSRQRVVRSRWVFEGLCRWHPRRSLEAGEYFFDRPITMLGVWNMLANGRVYVRAMVVPEGYSMFDIANLVEREGFTSRDDFLNAAHDPTLIRDLSPNASSLEGFLFPAAYEFPRHLSGAMIAAAMVKRFRLEWMALSPPPPALQAADGKQPEPRLPLYGIVTLASLVERETPKAEERPVVAGVFLNRLRSHVPLQCDPTVVYALELAGKYDGRLDASSLRFESSYNTYRHPGLPPGPIANPGDASLRAALEPPRTDYFYFVSDTEGGHFFSKTLGEHNRNVALYRQRITRERSADRYSNISGSTAPASVLPMHGSSSVGTTAIPPRRLP